MPQTSTQVSVEFDVISIGEVTSPEAWVFRPPGGGIGGLRSVLRPGSKVMQLPLRGYVVRHPTAGIILVDTGLHPDAAENLRGDYGLLNWVLFRSLRPAPLTYGAQLRELGVEPNVVEAVVMTHLHADHTSGMRLLPAAEFVISRAEWGAATSRGGALNGYVGGHLPPAERVRQIDFEAGGQPYGPFAHTVDLLGDGSIRLISTPGHTPGHMSVLLQLADEAALLIGDAVYTLRSLEEELLPFRTVDDETYLRSLREIKAFREAHPSGTFIPTHDETAWR